MTRQRLDAIRLRQLALLTLIEETGSIGEAARRMHLTQPTVSQMLRELEAALGTTLAVRDARGARLTGAARVALRRFRIALNEIREGAAALREEAGGVVLRVGTIPLAAVGWVPRTVAALRAAGGGFHLDLREDSVPALRRALAVGALDCVVSRLDTGSADDLHDDIAHVPLAPDALVMVCRRGHAALRASGLDGLAGHEWILPHRDLYTRQAVERWFLRAGLKPPVPTIESQSFHTNLRIVAESDLLAVVPRAAFDAYRGALDVEALHSTAPEDSDMMALVWRRSAEALPEFLAFRAKLLESM